MYWNISNSLYTLSKRKLNFGILVLKNLDSSSNTIKPKGTARLDIRTYNYNGMEHGYEYIKCFWDNIIIEAQHI